MEKYFRARRKILIKIKEHFMVLQAEMKAKVVGQLVVEVMKT